MFLQIFTIQKLWNLVWICDLCYLFNNLW